MAMLTRVIGCDKEAAFEVGVLEGGDVETWDLPYTIW
jgi:hypothetical protein